MKIRLMLIKIIVLVIILNCFRCKIAQGSIDSNNESNNESSYNEYIPECPCDEFYIEDENGVCIPDVSKSREVCQKAWQEWQATLDPNERGGDPFELLEPDQGSWILQREYEGVTVDLVPTQYSTFEVPWPGHNEEKLTVSCSVPVAWVALAYNVDIDFDESLKKGSSKIMLGDKILSGYDVVGGLFFSYHDFHLNNPYDANLAWFLKKSPLPLGLDSEMKNYLGISANQPFTLISILDLIDLSHRSHPGIALSFSASESFDDIPYWAFVRERDHYRFFPYETPPQGKSPANSILLAKIDWFHAMGVWDTNLQAVPPCNPYRNGGERCNKLFEKYLKELFERTLMNGEKLYVHILWQASPFYYPFVTTSCIEPSGILSILSTRRVEDMSDLGLPEIEELTCDWPTYY